MDEQDEEYSVDVSRTFSGEWNMEKEMAASENVEDLRLELSKDEDEKLFAEVSDVFGGDDAVAVPTIDEQEEYSHHVDENSLVGVNDSPHEDVSTSHKRSREEDDSVLSNKKPHLDDEYVISDNDDDDDEGVGQSKKGEGLDDQLAEETGLENAGEELYEAEEELDQEVEAEDLELDQEAGLEEERQPASQSASIQGVSDFDLMMQKRKEAMQRARRRKRKDYDVTTNDDEILVVIDKMRQAANEDKQLNLDQKAATKKLKLLPIVLAQMNKSELKHAFVECGVLTVLTEWLRPLPDHSLPHIQIREGLLDILCTMPSLNSDLLKQSGIGKAVMLLYRHPKETRKNKEKAGKLINEWARPIFGLTSDLKKLSREERENRDYEHLSAAARRRLSSSEGSSRKSGVEEEGPQKPGDKGWVGRARVPMPSHKDYVVRPRSNVSKEGLSKSHKKTPGRYEKHMQKVKDKKSSGNRNKMHAATLSIEGRGLL